MTSGQVDDLTFIMNCLIHSTTEFPKPDFDKVSIEIGAKNANSCYQRFWNLKKKWGLTGSSTSKGKAKGGATAPKTPAANTSASATAQNSKIGKKRGRPSKAGNKEPATTENKKNSNNNKDTAGNDTVDNHKDKDNHSEHDHDHDDDDNVSVVETPSKKPKLADDAAQNGDGAK